MVDTSHRFVPSMGNVASATEENCEFQVNLFGKGRGVAGRGGEIYINVFNCLFICYFLGYAGLDLSPPLPTLVSCSWLLFSGLALLSSFPYSTNFFSLMFSHRKCWLVLFFLPFHLIVVKCT